MFLGKEELNAWLRRHENLVSLKDWRVKSGDDADDLR